MDIPSRVGRFEVQQHLLGAGSFGLVYRGMDPLTNSFVAIKLPRPERSYSDSVKASYKRELASLKKTSHRNIVLIMHHEIIEGRDYLVLEFCNFTLENVFSLLEPPQNLELQFSAELLSAVRHLHTHDIIHRDIKPENILVKTEGDSWVIKLTDFGLSRRVPDDGSSAFTATAGAGTQLWMAPEVFPGKDDEARYGKPADCFSAALVMDSLVKHTTGSLPPVLKGPRGRSYGRHVRGLLDTYQPVPPPEVGGNAIVQELLTRLLDADYHTRCKIGEAYRRLQEIMGTAHVSRSEGALVPPSPPSGDAAAEPQPQEAPVVEADDVAAGGAPAAAYGEANSVRTRVRRLVAQFEQTGIQESTQLSTQPAQPIPPRQPLDQSMPTERSLLFPATDPTGLTRDAAAVAISTEPTGRGMKLRKLGHVTLPETGVVDGYFVQANFLVGFKDSPNFYYFENHSDKLELKWQKTIPKEVTYNCWKYLSPRGEFYLQELVKEVCLYDQELRLIRTISSPGYIVSLLPGERALVGNECSPSSRTEGIKLAVTSATDLHIIYHWLDTPPEGSYGYEDPVIACGLEDGRLAVVVERKPYIDIYGISGHHVVRAALPGDAQQPSCTPSFIMVPLWKQPRVCVLDWAGDITHVLDQNQLGLHEGGYCHAVSPIHGGRLSVWVAPATGGQQINTYEVLS